ncbi:DUF1572 family protein [Paenibacillus tarimensis]
MLWRSLASHVLDQSKLDFQSLKKLGDRALGQLKSDEALHWAPDPESNNAAVIINHMSGNMISRWTDFLTSDGEKPDRNRDREFEDDHAKLEELLKRWETGWRILFKALDELEPDQLLRKVMIRGQKHTVIRAIHRQLTHYGYHVGQLVYVAKACSGQEWQTLSVPKGGSDAFNEQMIRKVKAERKEYTT